MSKITDEKDLIVHLEIEKHIANIIGIQESMNDSICPPTLSTEKFLIAHSLAFL